MSSCSFLGTEMDSVPNLAQMSLRNVADYQFGYSLLMFGTGTGNMLLRRQCATLLSRYESDPR